MLNPKIRLIIKNAFKDTTYFGKSIIISPDQFQSDLIWKEVNSILPTWMLSQSKYSAIKEIRLKNQHTLIFITDRNPDYLCGYRANIVYLNKITNPETIQLIARPLLSVQFNPVEQEKTNEFENELIRLGIYDESDRTKFPQPKLINLDELGILL